jgi:nitrite reductase (NO-forming)
MAVPTTRRDFLARTSLLGFGIPALGAVFAGCEGEKGGEGERGKEGGEETEAKEPGGAPPTAVVPFQRYDPALPPLQPGRPREVRLVARNETVAISGDTAMRAWTFNGTVPGPILHLRQGDPVQVTLTNQGTLAHSIDLHAARIDPEIAFRSIAPGESTSYTFTPQYAGAFLYHCGTAPLLLHIGSGMYGAVIVDPPTPLPPAREFVLVHSGFYLNDGGEESEGEGGEGAGEEERGEELRVYDPSYQKMLSVFPDQVAFNGHSYQYRAVPITVRSGERVRFYVVSAGPTEDCSFHIVGEVFDTVYLGAPPGNTIHGVQTYSVPAGGGMIFEFVASIPGRFTFVDHKFGHGDKGAAGLLVVEP